MGRPAPKSRIEDLPGALRPARGLPGSTLAPRRSASRYPILGLQIATPFHTIRRTKFGKDAEALLALCTKEKVGGLVLGLPVNMNGTEGPRAQATRAFLRNLAPLTDLPVVLWDERLSTAAAERAMLEADLSRRKRAEKIDAAAAAFILQGALDRLASLRRMRRLRQKPAHCVATCRTPRIER